MDKSNNSKKNSFEETAIIAGRTLKHMIIIMIAEIVIQLGISLIMIIIFSIIIYAIFRFILFNNEEMGFVLGVVLGIAASAMAIFISIHLRELKKSREALLMGDKKSNQDLIRRIEFNLNQKLKKEE